MMAMPSVLVSLLRLLAVTLPLGWALDRWLGRRRIAPAAPDAPAALRPPRSLRRRTLACGGLAVVAALLAGGWQWKAAWEAEQVARSLTGGEPTRAPVLITRYGCGGCHAIPGVPGADGRVAAPLAGLRERVYVGGVLRNTADNLVAWIVDPRAASPRSAMPATGITEAEARDVAAWLYAH
jgi:cytochrome c1